MRKVVLVSLHFPPSAASGAFRMLGFARHLPAFGWSTSVVTCDRVPYEPVDPVLGHEIPAATVVRYVPYPNARAAEIGRRLLTMSGVIDAHSIWCYTARHACDQWIAEVKPDVVLTSGPPHSVHLLGRWLKRRHGVRLVTDFRDTWVKERRDGSRPHSWRAALERATMQASDGIIANAPRARDALARAYPDCAARMVMIPNGFDPAPHASAAERPADDRSLTLLHAGELYAGRDPRGLLDAIGAAERSHAGTARWRLRFIGRTAEAGVDIVAEARRRGLESQVTIEGQVPYQTAKDEMRRAGILLLIDGPGRRIGVPAKVYEYIGANRPILALAEPDGDTAWALAASNALFRLARPDDPAAIEQALGEITAVVRRGESPTSGSIPSSFTRQAQARRLASFLERVTSGRDAIPEAEPVAGAEPVYGAAAT